MRGRHCEPAADESLKAHTLVLSWFLTSVPGGANYSFIAPRMLSKAGGIVNSQQARSQQRALWRASTHLDFDPRSELDNAVGRDVEEVAGTAGIARHRREHAVAP